MQKISSKKNYRKRRNYLFRNESKIIDSILKGISYQKHNNSSNNISNDSTIDSPKKGLIDSIPKNSFKFKEEDFNHNSFIPKSFKMKQKLEKLKDDFENELINNKEDEELLNIKIRIEGGEIKNLILKNNKNLIETIESFCKENKIDNQLKKGILTLINKTLFAIYIVKHREYSNEEIEFFNKIKD